MAVTDATFTHYRPDSYLPNFVYFPLFFKPSFSDTPVTLNDVKLETDSRGIRSIIRLVDKDDNRITPFIDLSKYDIETKDWYLYYDEIEKARLPFRQANDTLTNMYPSALGVQTNWVVNKTTFNSSTNEITVQGTSAETPGGITFTKYAPIVLVGNNKIFTDLTDYTNITAHSDKLSFNSSDFEFYYDFEERIFTNTNLDVFQPQDLKIVYSFIDTKEVSLKCLMSANSGKTPKETPIVDDYVFKLRGQYLRS